MIYLRRLYECLIGLSVSIYMSVVYFPLLEEETISNFCLFPWAGSYSTPYCHLQFNAKCFLKQKISQNYQRPWLLDSIYLNI